MKNRLRMFPATALVAALATLWSANLQAAGSKSIELVTNNNLKGPNTASFFKFTGTGLIGPESGPTGGKGIGGGFASLDGIILFGTHSELCGAASDPGSSDIATFKIVKNAVTLAGRFTDAKGSGKAHGIGLAGLGKFLVAAYTSTKNIGVWGLLPSCKIKLLANYKTPYAVAGMRLSPRGNALIVGYGAGVNKVDSFSTTPTGKLTERGPYPAKAGAAGIDITQDSAYAIFGDTTSATTQVEIYPINSDGSLGKGKSFGGNGSLGAGVGSSNVWLSVDEKFLFVSNNSSKQVTSLGFTESPIGLSYINITTLNDPSNQITSVGGLVTVLKTGSGGYLGVAEDGTPNSFVGLLKINADGSTTEVSGSPYPISGGGPGLKSLLVGPPRPF